MARTRTWLVNDTIVRTAIVVVVGVIVSSLGSGSALAVASICDAITGNLVINCGFESGNVTPGWTKIPAAVGSDLRISTRNPHSGSYTAGFGAAGPLAVGNDDTITQSLTTAPGSQYTVKFWLVNDDNGSLNNDFKFFWDGILLVNLVNKPTFAYTEFTFLELGTGTDVLTFAGRNPCCFYLLDDVSVTGPAVPEPATLFLLGSGLAGLAAWRRRQAA